VLNELTPEDREFIQYLLEQMPVGFLYMSWQDFQITKKMNADKITESDINRLDLQLKLGAYREVQRKKDL
jgi:hypothetical protein